MTANKVPGSWLCPTGYGYREGWNAAQQANGTSLRRGVPPSQAELDAWAAYDHHISTCKDCKA